MSVAASVMRGLYEYALAKGAPEAGLVEAAGIDLAGLEDADRRLPFPRYQALMRAASRLCGDPAFALHWGRDVDLAQISIVGLIALASRDMMDAFAQLNRFGQLVVEVEVEGAAPSRFAHAVDARGAWIVDRRVPMRDFPEFTELTFARMISGSRRFGDTPFVLAVEVTHAAPAHAAEYERVFGAPVTFAAPWNAMRVDTSWFGRPVAIEPRYVFGVLARHADEMLAALQTATSLRARVERALMPTLHTGETTMTGVAASLGLSRSTLARRLRDEGVTFAEVLADLRRRLAVEYLKNRRVSVSEIAYLLGFSDPAAFSRAFRRWTGEAPRDLARRVQTQS
jgi:AraC-like DNA-binding protein